MFGRTKLKIGRPEDSREFQLLVKERDVAQAKLDEAGIQLRKSRVIIDEMAGASSAGAMIDPSHRKHQIERAEKARRDMHEAKATLADLEPKIGDARIRAAQKIADAAMPTFHAATKAFLLARLNRHADEIAAAVAVRSLANELSARRAMRGLAIPATMIRSEPEWQALREDVVAALASGILKRADLPAAVAEAWSL